MHKRTSEDKTPSEARPFSVCGWLCGQRQKPEFKSSRIVAKAKENIRFSSEKRMFCGADRQIRTADLILTKTEKYTVSCCVILYYLNFTQYLVFSMLSR